MILDFVNLIGADAYIDGNVGTGSPREMAEWLQYMTSDKPTSLTGERARNGRTKPWKIAYFGVGNEPWGCGGDMTPDYYVELFRRFATFLKAPDGARPLIVAAGGHDADSAVMDRYDPAKKVGFAVDEWGTWYDPEPARRRVGSGAQRIGGSDRGGQNRALAREPES